MKVIIVGGGQVGAYLAGLLAGRGHDIKLIEAKESRLPVLRQTISEQSIVHGNGAEPQVLEAAGIREADAVAAVTGADETNLVVATLARMEYGVRRVIGRVNNPKNAWLFTPAMGVDASLNQADMMARMVAEEMSMSDMMTLLKLHGGQYSLVERIVGHGSKVAGKKLRDIVLPEECVLVAVIRQSQLLIPRGDTDLRENDKVVAITNVAQMHTLAAALGGTQ